MDYRYRYLVAFAPNSIEANREKHIEASDLICKLMSLNAVCEVVSLKPNELVGDAKEFQAAVSNEVTAELNRARNVAVRFEDLCGVLELIAEATKSKKLLKFVKRSRKILNSSETSQPPD